MYLVACLVVLVVLQGSQPASGRRRLGRPAASVIGALERHHHSPTNSRPSHICFAVVPLLLGSQCRPAADAQMPRVQEHSL
jgi:hypothetical protein